MNEESIKQLAKALGTWCWHHDFRQFCEVTGFVGSCAEGKWRDLQNLEAALGAFDAATLTKILNSE